MVRKNCAWYTFFQNNSVGLRMAEGTEVGNWVSAYLDKNLDLLLRMTTSAGESSIKVEEEEGMNLIWEEKEVVVNQHKDLLNGELEEMMVDDDEVGGSGSPMMHWPSVKLETEPVENLDADLDAVALQNNQTEPHFGKETSQWTGRDLTKWGVPEEKKRKFSLRDDPLRLLCGWWFCGQEFPEWSPFHQHVITHLKEVRKAFSYDGTHKL